MSSLDYYDDGADTPSPDELYHNEDDFPDPVYPPDSWNYPWWFFSTARFDKGGPTYYGEDVHMPAEMYLGRSVMGIISAGLTFLLILFVILPIIKHRIESVVCAVNSVCIGAAISLCLVSPEWLYGCVQITSPMNYFHTSKEFSLSLGIHVGLASTNITLETIILQSAPVLPVDPSPRVLNETVVSNSSLLNSSVLITRTITTTTTIAPALPPPPFYFYNERIKMYTPDLFEPEMGRALVGGYPIPLLSAYRFLTSAILGFTWSQDLMQAGYHCYLAIIFALTVWFLTLVFIAAIPRYSCYTFIIIGCLLILTNVTYFYWVRLHHHFPPIYVSGEFVRLRYGICFWTCLITGLWSCMYGFTLAMYDVIYPDCFLTIFDLDYDHKCALAAAHRMNQKNGSTMSLNVFKEDDEEYTFEL